MTLKSSLFAASAMVLFSAAAANAAVTTTTTTFNMGTGADSALAAGSAIDGAADNADYVANGKHLRATSYSAFGPLNLQGTNKGLGLAYNANVVATQTPPLYQPQIPLDPKAAGVASQPGYIIEHYGFVQLSTTRLYNLTNFAFTPTYNTADGQAHGETWVVYGSNINHTPKDPTTKTYTIVATNNAKTAAEYGLEVSSSYGPTTLFSEGADGVTGTRYRYYDFISTIDPYGTAYNGYKSPLGLKDKAPTVQNDAYAIASVIATTASIPEPASWSLMILGVGGIGASARRRRSLTAAA
jgi:hypothetical protein